MMLHPTQELEPPANPARFIADHISIGDKKSPTSTVLFENYSAGLKTQRDAWCFNSSRDVLAGNIARTVDYYNRQLDAYREAKAANTATEPDDFTKDAGRDISWTRALRNDFGRQKPLDEVDGTYVTALYRPFFKQWLYFSRRLNEMVYQIPRIFPEAGVENRVIALPGPGEDRPFSVFMCDCIPDLHVLHGGQCFPLKVYEQTGQSDANDLFATQEALGGLAVRDGITDVGLRHFQSAYPTENITKEDLFYYVYGLLHSDDYRDRFSESLYKQLPRVPAVKKAEDFWAFVGAGRKLGDLHVNYEITEPYPVLVAQGDLRLATIPDPEAFFRVTKMRFAGSGKGKDRTSIIYNSNITITNIPEEAYEYVVNGKPAIEWVMERQVVKQDPTSGIVNDANRYATETIGDPRYPFDLLCRVITVSVETVKIVRGLPKLDI